MEFPEDIWNYVIQYCTFSHSRWFHVLRLKKKLEGPGDPQQNIALRTIRNCRPYLPLWSTGHKSIKKLINHVESMNSLRVEYRNSLYINQLDYCFFY